MCDFGFRYILRCGVGIAYYCYLAFPFSDYCEGTMVASSREARKIIAKGCQ